MKMEDTTRREGEDFLEEAMADTGSILEGEYIAP